MAPDQIVLAVAVDVAGALDMPLQRRVVEGLGRGDLQAIHLPGADQAAVVTPQEIGIAVAVEVAGSDDVPGRVVVDSDIDRVAIQLPLERPAIAALPDHVRPAVAI